MMHSSTIKFANSKTVNIHVYAYRVIERKTETLIQKRREKMNRMKISRSTETKNEVQAHIQYIEVT